MKRNGGLLRVSDLSNFRVPVERRPIGTLYRGLTAVSVPPPAGGIQVLLGLRLLEAILAKPEEAPAADWYESLARAVHVVFREREKWPIHPDTLTPSASGWLLSDSRVREIVEDMDSGGYSFDSDATEEPGETSHLCVADSDGMVVSLTQSIQSLFGAKVANRELGFVYNNYLWTCPRGDHPYRLKSRCLPMSNAAPTMIFRDGVDGPVLALGSAGSRRITSSILHVISGMVDRGGKLADAVERPRVHALLNGEVWLEGGAASEPVLHRLSARYRNVEIKPYRSSHMGAIQAVSRDGAGEWTGAADPRREGTAAVVGRSEGGNG
jgi:gamma-glutamyltranspeptidase/glutathione hydrolase